MYDPKWLGIGSTPFNFRVQGVLGDGIQEDGANATPGYFLFSEPIRVQSETYPAWFNPKTTMCEPIRAQFGGPRMVAKPPDPRVEP